MRVEQFYADQTLQKALDFDKNAPNLQLAMILANDAKESENGPIGDPTETALLDFFVENGASAKSKRFSTTIRVLHRFRLTQTEN